MSTNEFDVSMLEADVAHGLASILEDSKFDNLYQLSEHCGFKSRSTLTKASESGGMTIKTIERLGRGLGYKGCGLTVSIKVLKTLKKGVK